MFQSEVNIIDLIDKQIVQLLEKNARQSSKVLAKKLNISPATVRRRIGNLIKANVIRFIAVVDPKRGGFPFAALLSLDVELENLDAAIQALDKRPEIRWLCTSTGRANVVALAQFASPDELADFTRNEVSKIEGIKRLETSIILKREKTHYVLGVF